MLSAAGRVPSLLATHKAPDMAPLLETPPRADDKTARDAAGRTDDVITTQEDFDSLEDDILHNYDTPETESATATAGQSHVTTTGNSGTPEADLEDVIIREFGHVAAADAERSAEFFRPSPEAGVSWRPEPGPDPPSPLAAMTMNLSFAGCGFLGIYHLGVAHAFASHGQKLLMNVQKFGGASAGSLVAAALAVRGADPGVIQECKEFCVGLANTVHKARLGVLTPRLSLLHPLQDFLDHVLPEDAHVRASGRLYISVTEARTRKNHVRSEFDSKEQLIQYLLASSYIPKITGKKPVRIDGKVTIVTPDIPVLASNTKLCLSLPQKYLDGGMTDNLPDISPDGRTILVTPFSGDQDICPRDKKGRGWYVTLQGEVFKVNALNVKRGWHAFCPPKERRLERYYERGKLDAERFLRREGFYCEGPEVTAL